MGNAPLVEGMPAMKQLSEVDAKYFPPGGREQIEAIAKDLQPGKFQLYHPPGSPIWIILERAVWMNAVGIVDESRVGPVMIGVVPVGMYDRVKAAIPGKEAEIASKRAASKEALGKLESAGLGIGIGLIALVAIAGLVAVKVIFK